MSACRLFTPRSAYLPVDVLLGLFERDVHETVQARKLSCLVKILSRTHTGNRPADTSVRHTRVQLDDDRVPHNNLEEVRRLLVRCHLYCAISELRVLRLGGGRFTENASSKRKQIKHKAEGLIIARPPPVCALHISDRPVCASPPLPSATRLAAEARARRNDKRVRVTENADVANFLLASCSRVRRPSAHTPKVSWT